MAGSECAPMIETLARRGVFTDILAADSPAKKIRDPAAFASVRIAGHSLRSQAATRASSASNARRTGRYGPSPIRFRISRPTHRLGRG